MTPREERTALAVILFAIMVLVADLAAWWRLGRELAATRLLSGPDPRPVAGAGPGSAEGPTGDSAADLDALRRELAGED